VITGELAMFWPTSTIPSAADAIDYAIITRMRKTIMVDDEATDTYLNGLALTGFE
jgi:hypothetical protein